MDTLSHYYPDRHLLQYTFHISTNPAFVYVNNPKCGCTTAKASINRWQTESTGRTLEYESLAEIHNRDLNPLLKPNKFGQLAERTVLHDAEFFRFTLLRNPLQRLASAYASKLSWDSRERQNFNQAAGRAPDANLPISLFLQLIRENAELLDMNEHWRLQRRQIAAPVMKYDRICLFETLEADLLEIRNLLFPSSKLGIFNTLEHFPQNRSNSARILKALTETEIGMIHEIYQEDFSLYAAVARARAQGEALPDFSARPPADRPEPDLAELRTVLRRFESLGDNCEFGFVQRAHGLEPGGLLRWAVAPFPCLLTALHNRFSGIYLFENLVPWAWDMVLDQKSGFSFHSEMRSEKGKFIATAAERSIIFENEFNKIGYLTNRLLSRLRNESVIAVYKTNRGISLDEAKLLSAAISALGKAAVLVVRTGENPGQVTKLSDKLLIASIDKFAPYEKADSCSYGLWNQIISQAAALT